MNQRDTANWTMEEWEEFSEACERAIARAVRKALIEHKLFGQSIVVDDGDGPRWIPAEEIEIPPPVDDLPGMSGHFSTCNGVASGE